MSKFTSGEWAFDDLTETVNTVSDEARTICIMTTNGVEDFSNEDRANARLIAAAPEMYKMLKEELIPTSDYGGVLSLSREAKVSKLLAWIDGEETSHE